jgi:hypothetical protein
MELFQVVERMVNRRLNCETDTLNQNGARLEGQMLTEDSPVPVGDLFPPNRGDKCGGLLNVARRLPPLPRSC